MSHLKGLSKVWEGDERVSRVAPEGRGSEQKPGSNFRIVFRKFGQENEVLRRGHGVADEEELLVAGLLQDVVDRGGVVVPGRFVKAEDMYNKKKETLYIFFDRYKK